MQVNSPVNLPPTLARLKRQMKRRGISQHRVARAAGVDRTMVNKVVNGRAVSRKVMDAIHDLLAVRSVAS